MSNEISDEFININGANLWIARSGKGLPFLNLSGGPGLCYYLEPFNELIEDFFEIIRFQSRGCGKSENIPPFDINATVNDIEALRIKLGFEKWIIGGHSAGGTTSLAYALEYPQHVLAVFYIAGIGVQSNKQWKEELMKNYEEFGEEQPDFEIPINEEVQKISNASWEKYIQQPKLWNKISELDIPFLIIQGERDIRPNWPTVQLSNLLPNASYYELQGAEHWFWETHPKEIRELVLEFSNKHKLLLMDTN